MYCANALLTMSNGDEDEDEGEDVESMRLSSLALENPCERVPGFLSAHLIQ
ncbi:hypothetical protein [Streptomyces sp. NRRL S-481]|uniref:hypothetical protein n=1 Tax=Streptomyces sp. NRRL S-481 TaxID=1463911 RepID=UPI000AA0FA6E|nr:hypothetical protein [Streptomyces sp. NRRL S-481]